MKRVGAFGAKTHFSQLLSEVERTHRQIIIQRRGRDVAVLAPYEDAVPRSDEEKKNWILAELSDIRAAQPRAKPGERVKDLIAEGRER